MTGRTKFEQMLEHLVNEDTEQAKELFHQIVVEKSREIYENILAEDFTEAKDEDEEEMDEAKDEDEEESVEEAKDEEDEEEVEEDFAFGEADDDKDDTDAEMDMDMGDESGDDMGDEGSDDLEDRVVDLEDAIDELRAEFENMMGDEDMGDDDMGGDIGGPDGGDMGDDLENDITMKMGEDEMFMREYVEKVGGADYTKYGKMGDNGANAKSIVAGKNDMGGTSANILAGGESTTGGTKGGLANPTAKEENFGNINVPGGNAGKTAFKKKEPGHGAEKKGTGDNGDKSAQSPLNGLKSRAK
jgi:hypothetical protein